MGYYKFRLSDMLPNAWFYKLKDMGRNRARIQTKTSSHPNNQHHQFSCTRKSHYFTRQLNVPNTHFLESPRRSSKQSPRQKRSAVATTRSSSSVSAACSLGKCETSSIDLSITTTTTDSLPTELSFSPDNMTSCVGRVNESNPKDVVLDVSKEVPTLELCRIITKPVKFNDTVKSLKKLRSEAAENIKRQSTSTRFDESNSNSDRKAVKSRKSTANSSGMKLRVNSPRIASTRRIRGRKSVSSLVFSSSLYDSFALIKSSYDPYRDFRESMVEMITENNITANKDLEDLLGCYLFLNADEYHDVIIKAFKQIWIDLVYLRST